MDQNYEENGNPRLGVRDKRLLFATLLAKTERLFYLNMFPMDLEDFALSLESPEIENSWRTLREHGFERSIKPTSTIDVLINDKRFMLSLYDGKENHSYGYNDKKIFIAQAYKVYPELQEGNRFYSQVTEWAKRQFRLEEQILRTLKTIKSIVVSCNTVGQYERVSPELLGFLPEKYKLALKQMIKKSPYPATAATPEQIDTAISTLAYASLQPTHKDEEEFLARPTSYGGDPTYRLSSFPRSSDYYGMSARTSGL